MGMRWSGKAWVELENEPAPEPMPWWEVVVAVPILLTLFLGIPFLLWAVGS